MTRIRMMSLLMTCLGALPLHAAELSKAELASLFSSFEEVEWSEDEGSAKYKYFVYLDDPRSSVALRSDKRSTKALLKSLEEDPYDYGFSRTGRILASRGADILPQLLKALPESDSYYRICLVNLLSEISDPRRDAVFVAQLESLLTEKQDHLTDDIAEPLIRTAGAQGIQGAVPILKKFLTAEDIDVETRAEARIALGRLGALDPGSIPSVPYEIESSLSADGMGDHVALLELLLKYELIKAPLKLVEFESGDGPTEVLKGTIEGGTWYLRVGKEQRGRVPFYYTWHTGPLASAGYMGVAEERNGQWIVTYWRMMWIS